MALTKIGEGFGRGFVKMFGSRNDRIIKDLFPLVEQINSLEQGYFDLSDARLRQRTGDFRKRLEEGESLDSLLPDAFACVREASRRVLRMRHFDVQLLGGIVLHQGKIAEMSTGEGKTLVAPLAGYLNALVSRGVFVVTVNDYLARRDRDWMAPVFELLDMKVGAIQSQMSPSQRQVEYACDVTYGTNNEFGFDYLRDNMKATADDQVQKHLYYAIIDEVDSILVDEARTPLIISGPAEESTRKYYDADRIARKLIKDEHYEIKEKEHSVVLSESGIERAQSLAGVDDFYTGSNMDWPHHIEQALRAHALHKKDKEYVVKDGEVIIVDEFTGRLMEGRRWSDGLHQAVEAKEGLRIKEENQTLATITFQNYFRLFEKLGGMTGTAITEASEFYKIYKLEVVQIPTNKPNCRQDSNDVIYGSAKEKWEAVVREVEEVQGRSQPVLVGTTSIENSELLSRMLQRAGVSHDVLNAKHHEREAMIVANAGQPEAVTIATNMAGRGTDIVLGPGVVDVGGLHIVGTERHEARRIDNQLKGRAGRQGDPGSSRFFLSLEDELMRVFANDMVSAILKKLGLREGQDIQSPMVTRAVERAQRKVEERNFEIRKQLLEYDAVNNEQRKIIYSQRQDILEGRNLREMIFEMLESVVESLVVQYMEPDEDDQGPDLVGLRDAVMHRFQVDLPEEDVSSRDKSEVKDRILGCLREAYDQRERELGEENMRRVERFLLLRVVDSKWKEHLYALDHLKSGIGMRAYAQTDPKYAYKKEGYELFEEMIQSMQEEVTSLIFRLRVGAEAERPAAPVGAPRPASASTRFWNPTQLVHQQETAFRQSRSQQEAAMAASQRGETKVKTIRKEEPKVGRNDPCPCGSGKKYKKCHGSQ